MSGKWSVELTRDQVFIATLCLAATVRVLFFSVSLPFFPLDEELHFDAIRKYANGYSPQPGLPGFDQETVEIIELYQSPQSSPTREGHLFPRAHGVALLKSIFPPNFSSAPKLGGTSKTSRSTLHPRST